MRGPVTGGHLEGHIIQQPIQKAQSTGTGRMRDWILQIFWVNPRCDSFDARAAPWHKVARHSERGGAVTDRGLKDGSRGRGEK
jgi:hypothetical protein